MSTHASVVNVRKVTPFWLTWFGMVPSTYFAWTNSSIAVRVRPGTGSPLVSCALTLPRGMEPSSAATWIVPGSTPIGTRTSTSACMSKKPALGIGGLAIWTWISDASVTLTPLMPVSITRWTPLRGMSTTPSATAYGPNIVPATMFVLCGMMVVVPRALQDLIEYVDREFTDDFESAEIGHRGAPLLRRRAALQSRANADLRKRRVPTRQALD